MGRTVPVVAVPKSRQFACDRIGGFMGEESPEQEENAAPRSKNALKVGAMCLGAATLSLVAGLLVSTQSAPEEETEEKPDAPKVVELPPDTNLQPATTLSTARAFLREGNIGEAHRLFQKVIANTEGRAVSEELQFELAITSEGVGDRQLSIRILEGLASNSQSPELRAASTLGLARVRFRQRQYSTAEQILTNADISGLFAANPKLDSESRFLRAVALARLETRLDKVSPLSDRALIEGRFGWNIPQVLATADKIDPPEPIPVGSKVTGKGDIATVFANLDRLDIKVLIDGLAKSADVDVNWSKKAAEVATVHRTGLRVRARTFTSVLDLLLAQIKLSWIYENKTFTVRAVSELKPDDKTAWQRSLADRALWDALTSYPDSHRAPMALLTLGNLTADENPLDSRARYDELLRQYKADPLRKAALFNRAKVDLRTGDAEQAMKGFLEAAEMGGGTLWDSLVLLSIGQLNLEAGKARDAVNPLLRAVGNLELPGEALGELTDRDDALAAAVQTLAIAWFESGNPESANAALLRHRQLLQQEAFRDGTAFLTAIAKYEMATTEARRIQEAHTLIAALTRVRPETLQVENATLLIGGAWNRLGISAQSAAVYAGQLKRLRSDWVRQQVLVALIEYHELVGEESRVAELVAALAAVSGGTNASRVAKAEMSLRSGRVTESLETCRSLINVEGVDQTQILRVMGRAFEKQGNFEQAAICFSGMLPPEEASQGTK